MPDAPTIAEAHIARLAELAREQRADDDRTCVEWVTESGETVKGYGLLRVPEVGVVRCTMEAGMVFQVHVHEFCSEWLLSLIHI